MPGTDGDFFVKAIVFGASGQVGSALLAHLRLNGHTVVGTYATHASAGLLPFRMEVNRLSDLRFTTAMYDVGVICSALSNIDACKRDEFRSRSINVTATLALIADLRQSHIRPVFLSSDYVFSGAKGGYVEEDPVDPVTVYGKHKAEVEAVLLERVPEALIVRLSKVMTANPDDKTLLSDWYRAIRNRTTIRCASDQFFCPTYIEDVSNGLRLLLEHGASGVYHLCQPQRYDRASLLAEFSEFIGVRPSSVESIASERLGFLDCRSKDTSMSPAKFIALTGYRFTAMTTCFKQFAERIAL